MKNLLNVHKCEESVPNPHMCEKLVSKLTQVKNYYQILTYGKHSYQIIAYMNNWYLIVTIVSDKVRKGAKIRNRYNQVPHLTRDTNGKVTNSQKDTANEIQEVSPFPAGDHNAHINRRTQRHSKCKTEKT